MGTQGREHRGMGTGGGGTGARGSQGCVGMGLRGRDWGGCAEALGDLREATPTGRSHMVAAIVTTRSHSWGLR